ncbi:MAG: type II toxin-antitoxin system VapC family toxin [Kiritimatiellae bacterium]|nr:type II toxin-antitoxin system VapC family toxin [Kiritimatiellia bacterium]
MKFWDSSALVPLFVEESATAAMRDVLRADREVIAWWCTPTECASAIARLEREGSLTTADCSAALRRLDDLCASWYEVQPVPAVRVLARRLLRAHNLRAADALQLAAAVVAAENDPSSLAIVSLDARFSTTAAKEGFTVFPARGE